MNTTAKNFVKFLLVIIAIIAAIYFIAGNMLKDEYKVHVSLENVECLEKQTEVFYTIRNVSETGVSFLRVVITATNKMNGRKESYQVKLTDGILGNERRKASLILPRYDCGQTDFTVEWFTF